MKKTITIAVTAALLISLTGCGNPFRGDPTTLEEIKEFKRFIAACIDAGGFIDEGRGSGYYCNMDAVKR